MVITKSLWSMVMLIIIHTRNGNGEEEIIVVHIKIDISLFNHLTPNGHFTGRTAPLTYRGCIFLFIQQLYVLNILNILHTLRFFLFKMSFIL
jgi:hypothetical protein